MGQSHRISSIGCRPPNDTATRSMIPVHSSNFRCTSATATKPDVITRYSGHEFVCSLSGQDARVRGRFDQVAALMAETHRGATITVGLAEADAEESLDALIARSARATTASQNGGSAPRR